MAVRRRPSARGSIAVVWFRKCLRLHDNLALLEADKVASQVVPIFVIDPHFSNIRHVGVNRYNFLLESLQDLDDQLKANYSSRLFVLRGTPEETFGKLFDSGSPLLPSPPDYVMWEHDTEPYAQKRDAHVAQLATKFGVEVRTFVGHTLYDTRAALETNGQKAPISMPAMEKLVKKLGDPPLPQRAPARLGAPPGAALRSKMFSVPTLSEMGYTMPAENDAAERFPGGETAGLKRLAKHLRDTNYILKFDKPKTQSTSFKPPSTTGLSAYLKFGCVSARRFFHELKRVCSGKAHTKPPGSLLGQLYFREMSYLMGESIPNFHKQVGNPSCKQIPWTKSPQLLAAWEKGQTGFPFIDAAMRQLVRTGWLHHLARHAVACFLTRGDLWVSWEDGRDVFDRHLLDADWAVNNMNWLALSGAAAWSPPYFRVYSPVPKMDSSLNVRDPMGDYIREYVPELRDMPSEYIYEPWKAPRSVQEKIGCIVGKDYPRPIVDHAKVSQANLANFKKALSASKSAGPAHAGTSSAPTGKTSKRPRSPAPSKTANKALRR